MCECPRGALRRAIVLLVTGWQGDEGGQRGWNQPPNNPQGGDPYSPDPYGYQDPYGNQSGGYQSGPQGTSAYPYGGGNPYSTGGFPAQDPGQYGDPYGSDQYGQYDPYGGSGFPGPGYGPPKRSKLPMILGVLAIVIIVGAVVAIVLVNRQGDDNNTANPPPQSSSQRTAPPSGKNSAEPPSSGEPGGRDGWQTIDNTADAELTYQVPPDWKPSDAARPSGLDVDFTGTAEYGIYECEGASYARSFATSGDVQSKKGADLDLNKTVSDFAKSFATGYFKDTAKVATGTPEETEIGGKKAAKLTLAVTPQVSVPKCEASKGEIAIVGVLIEQQGKPAGVAMLVVVSDVAGGPDDPKPLPQDVAQDILASARPAS
jgi:hypothetical protein